MLAIVLLSVFGVANLFLSFLKKRQILFGTSVVFIMLTLVASLGEWSYPITLSKAINNDMISSSPSSVLFTFILLLITALLIPLSEHYVQNKEAQPAEYYALMFFSLVGAIMMISYENLLMLFIGIEIVSIVMYILAGAEKRNLRSNEASVKYFLQGAFATGIFLFGVAMLYGASGGFSLTLLQKYTQDVSTISPMLYVGLVFVLVGMLFKVSIAPFHFWTADVYEGSPTLFTAFMATIVKTAGFAAIYKLLSSSFTSTYNYWQISFVVMVGLTLLIANLTAVSQQSFKRMMAFSSISHAGYLLLAVTAFNDRTLSAIIFYSLAYSLATISAFGVLLLVSEKTHNEEYTSFNGLAKTNPFLALVMTIAMLSLAGMPLTAGFFGKLWVFISAYERGLYEIMVLAALMSVVGLYYYFRVVIAMYLKEPHSREGAVKAEVSAPYIIVFLVTTLLTVLLGIFPDWLLKWL